MPLHIAKPTTLYSVNEAAKVFGVSRITLWKAIKAGKLPVIRYAKWVFIRETDLRKWHAKDYRSDMARKHGHKNEGQITVLKGEKVTET